jgi:hypothetical protein
LFHSSTAALGLTGFGAVVSGRFTTFVFGPGAFFAATGLMGGPPVELVLVLVFSLAQFALVPPPALTVSASAETAATFELAVPAVTKASSAAAAPPMRTDAKEVFARPILFLSAKNSSEEMPH